MDARSIDRFESGAERAASALFAAAVGYAAYMLAGGFFLQPQPWPFAAAAVAASYFVSASALKAVGTRARSFSISVFDVREIETFEAEDELLLTDADRVNDELLLTEADRFDGELVLTDADRLHPVGGHAAGEPLVLDDILTEIGPDARVVRLFDRRAMPTPGQLKSRIDSHLDQSPPAPASDAAQALSAALAELRRSLR
jgi:hypothetical protein